MWCESVCVCVCVCGVCVCVVCVCVCGVCDCFLDSTLVDGEGNRVFGSRSVVVLIASLSEEVLVVSIDGSASGQLQ